ncbi:hypothetical protein [Fimbriiglobus ruber]|uniref:hypothetical protein n=1 Tax=Fimbriiglobus ruber TaxID=1908690 RepID=UPI001179A8A0|nr:hypothetical protein [Fimbriiglobus ruber]
MEFLADPSDLGECHHDDPSWFRKELFSTRRIVTFSILCKPNYIFRNSLPRLLPKKWRCPTLGGNKILNQEIPDRSLGDNSLSAHPNSVAPQVAPPPGSLRHSSSSSDTMKRKSESEKPAGEIAVTGCPGNEKAPVTSPDITGAEVGLTGFEPATSWSRTAP